MTRKTILLEVSVDDYVKLCEVLPYLFTRPCIKTSMSNVQKRAPCYEVSDKSILNQYRILSFCDSNSKDRIMDDLIVGSNKYNRKLATMKYSRKFLELGHNVYFDNIVEE